MYDGVGQDAGDRVGQRVDKADGGKREREFGSLDK